MSDPKSEAFTKARHAFDELKMDERATFLVEAVVSMLADGVGEAGRVAREVIDEVVENLDRACREGAAREAPKDEAGASESGARGSARKSGSRRARGARKPADS